MIALHICFTHLGIKWPLRDQDAVEIWTTGHQLVATLPGSIIRHFVELHLASAHVDREVQAQLRPPLAKLAPRPIRTLDPHHQQMRRQQRRSRRA